MVGCSACLVDVHGVAKFLKQFTFKLRALVCVNLFWEAMSGENVRG